MRQKPFQARQGDLLLNELDPVTADAVYSKDATGDSAKGILARGEATGHMHRLADLDGIVMKVMIVGEAERILIDTRGRTTPLLLHHGPGGRPKPVVPGVKPTTHGTIEIPPGKVIEVIQQRQGSANPRQVLD